MNDLKIAMLLLPMMLGQVAFADEPIQLPSDVPAAYDILNGRAMVVHDGVTKEALLPSGTYLNSAGMLKLENAVKAKQLECVQLKTENETLKTKIDEVASQPKMSVLTVVAIVTASAVAGAGIATGVIMALR